MRTVCCLFLCLFLFSCAKKISPQLTKGSGDQKAIDLAHEVLAASGGESNWEKAKFIHWNFFGSRTLLWDKHNSRVRIESKKEDYKAIVNLQDTTGMVFKDGELLTQPDSLKKYLIRANNIWINDSYWLVMPFKLLDPGVTLKYIGKDTTALGANAEVISLSFDKVGKTPENIYHVFIDSETKLVSQWSFYPDSSTDEPNFSTPWANYKSYGKLILSGDRGGDYALTEIKVSEEVDLNLFKKL